MLHSIAIRLLFALAIFNVISAKPFVNLKPFFSPVEFPAPQVSVTSTAFNPAIQNPGGTTNSAGTFDVVSLSQSTSVAIDTNIPITTSFVISPAPFAPAQPGITPDYYTQITTSSPAYNNPATTAPVSLATTVPGVSPVSALTTVKNGGAIVNVQFNGGWTLILSACAAVMGALIVL